MKKYYIYSLIDPRNNQLFYVGKGTFVPGRTARWRGHIYEAKKWDSACRWGNINKLQTIKEILSLGLEPISTILHWADTEDEVFFVERQLISKYGRIGVDPDGILTNLTIGGEGTESRTLYKKDMIRRKRTLMLGSRNPMFGKHHTDASKQLIRETKETNRKLGLVQPFNHTEEHKKWLRENNPGAAAASKPIYQIDTTTGQVVNLWKSTKQAGDTLGITSWRNISVAATKHKTRTVGGWYWRWKDDEDVINGKLRDVDRVNQVRTDRSMKNSKRIYQYDSMFNYVRSWKNMSAAARNIDLHVSVISRAAKTGKLAGGYHWSTTSRSPTQ